MKNIILLCFIAMGLLSACNKTCTADIPACTERPDNGTVCQAAFESWFYDESTGTCALVVYSGCEELGFETQGECDNCDCR